MLVKLWLLNTEKYTTGKKMLISVGLKKKKIKVSHKEKRNKKLLCEILVVHHIVKSCQDFVTVKVTFVVMVHQGKLFPNQSLSHFCYSGELCMAYRNTTA